MTITAGVRPPALPFRVLRGRAPHAVYFRTEAGRDLAAQRYADRDRETVAVEMWTPRLALDPLNEGWACMGVRRPTVAIKETVTPTRLLALRMVAEGRVRWGGVKPHASGCVFVYADAPADVPATALNRAVLWLLRGEYVRTASDDYDPPVGSLVSATAKGRTELARSA